MKETFIFNPLEKQHTPDELKFMAEFLQLYKTINYWAKGESFPLPDELKKHYPDYQEVVFKYPLLKRTRSKQKTEERYEVIDNNIFHNNNNKSYLFQVLATLSFNQAYCSIKHPGPNKKRIMKIDIIKPDINPITTPHFLMVAGNIAHMHYKPAVRITKQISSIVMRYIPGKDLLEFIQKELQANSEIESIPLNQRIQLTLSILRALQTQVFAYEIVHRDIKLENIRIEKLAQGYQVSIIDYQSCWYKGIKFNNKELGGCTLNYMPPEYYEDGDLEMDYSFDIFSMARVLMYLWHVEEMYSGPKFTLESYERFLKRGDFNFKHFFAGLKSFDDIEENTRIKIQDKIKTTLLNMHAKLPGKRPSIDEAIDAFEETSRLLNPNIETNQRPVINQEINNKRPHTRFVFFSNWQNKTQEEQPNRSQSFKL